MKEEVVVQVTTVDVAIDQRADKAVIARGALQLGCCSRRVTYRQGGEAAEPVGVVGDRNRRGVVGLASAIAGTE